jgi:hypothetical protein
MLDFWHVKIGGQVKFPNRWGILLSLTCGSICGQLKETLKTPWI